MRNRKNTMRHLMALGALVCGFVLCRYVLFDLHGMEQWPEVLFGVGLIMLLLSLLAEGKMFLWFVSAAYPIGFAAGVLFQSDNMDPGGGRTNNLWLLWTIIFIVGVLTGTIYELLKIWQGRNNGG